MRAVDTIPLSLSLQFYLVSFVVVFILARVGEWISTVYILQLIGIYAVFVTSNTVTLVPTKHTLPSSLPASALLLLPTALTHGWVGDLHPTVLTVRDNIVLLLRAILARIYLSAYGLVVPQQPPAQQQTMRTGTHTDDTR